MNKPENDDASIVEPIEDGLAGGEQIIVEGGLIQRGLSLASLLSSLL
jgi:hypothetical protein